MPAKAALRASMASPKRPPLRRRRSDASAWARQSLRASSSRAAGVRAPDGGFEELVGEHSFSVRDQVPPKGAHDFGQSSACGQKWLLHRFRFSGSIRIAEISDIPRLCRDTGPPSLAGFVFLGLRFSESGANHSAPRARRLPFASSRQWGARVANLATARFFRGFWVFCPVRSIRNPLPGATRIPIVFRKSFGPLAHAKAVRSDRAPVSLR